MLLVGFARAQYDTHESEEEDDREEAQPRVDYTKYFSGVGGSVSPVGVTPHAVEGSSGFVQPLDFTGLFVGGQFGLDGLTGGASQQVFQTPGSASIALPPLSAGSFPLHQAQAPSNTSGFVSNINFPSLFDTSGSPSELGFRPQDFIPKETRTQPLNHGRIVSPAFSNLQRDVDKEVNFQRKEEAFVEQSRAASRRHPVEDDEDEDEDFDPSEYEFGDSPILDINDRSPQKYLKQPYEEDEDYGNPHTKGTAYSSGKTIHYPISESRLAESKQRKPLPTLREPEEDDYDPYDERRKEVSNDDLNPNQRPPPKKVYYPTYPSDDSDPDYKPSPTSKHKPRPYSSPKKPVYPRPNQYPPSYSSAQTKNFPISQQSISGYNPVENGPVIFKPSPRDPYLTTPNVGIGSGPYRPQVRDGPYPLPQTKFATVIPRSPAQPIASASEIKKSCKKVEKKIDPENFARFKREQMTCYVCTNKEKGNTYEECSYESEPKGNSYFKGSAEAYSSDTVLTPKSFHVRDRRNVEYSFRGYNNNDDILDSEVTYKKLIRKVRQYDHHSDPDERGHGPENYRFGPEHFKNTGKSKRTSTSQRRYDDERDEHEEEDEEGEENDEESDIEKEYQAPGASNDDDCERVDKNGLACMVCVNSKTGGSYEQCSYASEPEANRYEYARQSTYGSKRPGEDRYKRYTDPTYQINDSKEGRLNKKNHIRLQRKPDNIKTVNGEFQRGKLKRKKVIKGGYIKKPITESESKIRREKMYKAPGEDKDIAGVVGLDPYFYGSVEKYDPNEYDEKGRKIKNGKKKHSNDDEASATSAEEDIEDFTPTYEDTFFRLFPELEGVDPYTGEKEGGEPEQKEIKDEDFNHPVIPYEEAEDEEESESKQQNKKVKLGFEYPVAMPSYYFDDDESKKDLEKTLDEFVHKNRSECKKIVKNQMTCYQCLDQKGMQHEECMFVAASEPKSKHLSYHEVKEFRVDPKEKSNNSDTNLNSTETGKDKVILTPPYNEEEKGKVPSYDIHEGPSINVPEITSNEEIKPIKDKRIRRKKYYSTNTPPTVVPDNEGQPAITYDIKKITPKHIESPITVSDESSTSPKALQRKKRRPEDHEAVVERKGKRREEGPEDDIGENHENEGDEENRREESPKTRPNYNSIPPDPEGFDEREGPEGAYSHETEPVFDPVLKITLPKYMLSRSEHEAIFDEVFRSG